MELIAIAKIKQQRNVSYSKGEKNCQARVSYLFKDRIWPRYRQKPSQIDVRMSIASKPLRCSRSSMPR